jgi:multicomponent K+:H+ antiporter subunit E
MTRWLPHPFIAMLLFAFWLLLNQGASPALILLGGLLAAAGSWALSLLDLPRGRVRSPRAIGSLLPRVTADIVRSNAAVARIILGLAPLPNSGFVRIKLELTSPYALAALACIITATPGTVWVAFDPGNRILTIHVLDLVDESDWIDTIKTRYERPLLEAFE